MRYFAVDNLRSFGSSFLASCEDQAAVDELYDNNSYCLISEISEEQYLAGSKEQQQ